MSRRLTRVVLATATAALLISPLTYAAQTSISGSASLTASGAASTSSNDSGASQTSGNTSGSAQVSGNASATAQTSGSTQTSGNASATAQTSGSAGSGTATSTASDQGQFAQAFQGKSLAQVQAGLTVAQTVNTIGSAVSGALSQTAQNVLQATKTLLSQNPNNSEALQAKGVAEAALGDHVKAVSALEAAIALNPNATSTSYATLGNMLTSEGHTGIKMFADGKAVDFHAFGQTPVVRNGSTLVPVRAIMTALGANVSWDSSTRTVIITKGSTTIQLQMGSTTATVNGKVVTMPEPPALTNGRTLLPIRFVAQMLGEQVQWYGSSHLIVLVPTASSTSSTVTTSGTATAG